MSYDSNIPKLKDKVNRKFAIELFNFLLITKNVRYNK